MVDGQHLVALAPGLGRAVGLGDHALQAGVVGQVGADDGGVQLAGQQHVHRLGALGRADEAGRIGEFGQVAVFKRHPLDVAQVHAVVIGQHAAHPGHRGLRVGANANALAAQVLQAHRSALGVVNQTVVLEAPRANHGGHQGEGFAIGFGLQKGHQSQLGQIELQLTYHALEGAVGHLHVGKIKAEVG